MNQSAGKEIISPEVFQEWKRRAAMSEGCESEWGDYLNLMTAFQAALQRAPCSMDACKEVSIEELLISELEHLADVVHSVFPRGGMLEFASYVTDAKRRAV